MINKREVTLLVAFVGMLVLVGGFIGWRMLSQNLFEQKVELSQRFATVDEMQDWLSHESLWNARAKWLQSNKLPIFNEQQSEANFVQDIQSSLANHNLQVTEQKIEETKYSPRIVETSIDLVLSTSLEGLIKWLYDVQKVGAFRNIPHLKIRSDKDSSKLRVELTLTQAFTR